MKQIILRLKAGNTIGTATATVTGSAVQVSAMQWSPAPADSHTESASFTIVNGPSITMNGDAWRTFESSGLTEDVIRLLVLSPARAETLVRLAEETGDTCYRGLVTRDGDTESCTTYAATDDADVHLRQADEEDQIIIWSTNDNGSGKAYLGGGSDDIEEVSIAEVLADFLMASYTEAAKEAMAKAFDFTKLVARMTIPGDKTGDGSTVEEGSFISDAPWTLERLVQESRRLTELCGKSPTRLLREQAPVATDVAPVVCATTQLRQPVTSLLGALVQQTRQRGGSPSVREIEEARSIVEQVKTLLGQANFEMPEQRAQAEGLRAKL